MKPYDEQNAQAIIKFWTGKISDYAICGFLSNWNIESNLRPNNMQNSYEGKDPYYWNDEKYTAAVDSGTYKDFSTDRIGYGLAQWTSSGRKEGLYNYVRSNARSIGDMQTQLEYAEIELMSNSFKKTREGLEACQSAGEAAVIIMTTYEKPASMNDPVKQKERADMAEEFYQIYFSGGKKTDKLLAISAGHYLYTAGKRCDKRIDPLETREWVLNARVADFLTNMLSKYDGVKVLRLDDPTGEIPIKIEERAKVSDANHADFYLAIHHNAARDLFDGGGVVVYHYPLDRNKAQATELYKDVTEANGLVGNRATPIVATNELYEVAVPQADSILLENGYMNSTVDTPIILTEQFAVNTAKGLCKFFVDYWRLELKQDGSVSDILAEIESIRNNIKALEVELDKKLEELRSVLK